MKILDAHIHIMFEPADPASLLARTKQAGIEGGCVFSSPPKEYDAEKGLSFEARMKELEAFSPEGPFYPVLWIHPYEEDILENVRRAAQEGVCAFKIICNNFYVGDEKSLTLLREIAALGKPVLFHTGILWDGKISSDYNRPMNWEAVIPIEGLRFSLAHCSWPWVDECIALYGKIAAARWTSNTAEMFFDTTPGTPRIYRKDMMTKLYKIGYHVSDNVFFGTDSQAHCYNPDETTSWIDYDTSLLKELEVSQEDAEKMFSRNLLRFLGKA